MSKVFILYNNPRHDFSNIAKLLPNHERVFIFQREDLPQLTIESCKSKLEDILDCADTESDYIVMNGPSYMAACAGYVWFTQSRAKNNIIYYSPETKTYVTKAD
jgi:hypothetical protein